MKSRTDGTSIDDTNMRGRANNKLINKCSATRQLIAEKQPRDAPENDLLSLIGCGYLHDECVNYVATMETINKLKANDASAKYC